MDLIQNKFLLYKDGRGDINIDVLLKDETVWMTQKAIGELFGKERSVITKHISNIYKQKELKEVSTCANFARVQNEGGRDVLREHAFYNLDVILSVGYRTNSKQATQFRIWATKTLKEYIIKGFVLDEERLKNGKHFGKDYFKELLAKIRDIRTSERRLYQQLKDIYAMSADYDKKSKSSIFFFANVQNKIHFAITGNTSAEIIHNRVDANKRNMGLTSWRNEKIRKDDIVNAKSYLENGELEDLKEIVNMFLDFAERKVRKEEKIYKEDWKEELGRFLEFHKLEVLKHRGKISRKEAIKKAVKEYIKFKAIEKIKEKENSIKEINFDIEELENIAKKLKN